MIIFPSAKPNAAKVLAIDGCIGLRGNRGIIFKFGPFIDIFLKRRPFEVVSSVAAESWEKDES